jgi:hypothetical protein
MKRVFGTVEAIFDILYLASALIIGITLVLTAHGDLARSVAGVMALVLVIGDAFHLIPRVIVIQTGKEKELRNILGRGKQVASITMTIFYVILWQLGMLLFFIKDINLWSYIVYILATMRIIICLMPQNKWEERYPPLNWAIWRNVPFVLQGILVAVMYLIYRNAVQGFSLMWLAITLSFAFYLPVVLWANKKPKIGMLMLPKSCAYIWILVICLSL